MIWYGTHPLSYITNQLLSRNTNLEPWRNTSNGQPKKLQLHPDDLALLCYERHTHFDIAFCKSCAKVAFFDSVYLLNDTRSFPLRYRIDTHLPPTGGMTDGWWRAQFSPDGVHVAFAHTTSSRFPASCGNKSIVTNSILLFHVLSPSLPI